MWPALLREDPIVSIIPAQSAAALTPSLRTGITPGPATAPGPPEYLPPGAGAARHDTLAQEGFDATALARVNGFIDQARVMLRSAGASDAELGAMPQIDWIPGMGTAGMNVSGNSMLLGTDSRTGSPYSRSGDVVVHEYAHAVVGRLAPFAAHSPEADAAQESLADTFAAAVDRDDWTMGEDLFPAGAGPERSMTDPASVTPRPSYGVKRLPAHISEFARDANPHANAGIGNRAAAAIGQALGRDRMAQIYVSAVRDQLAGPLSFYTLADATLAAAGADAGAQRAVTDAWRAVGITPGIARA